MKQYRKPAGWARYLSLDWRKVSAGQVPVKKYAWMMPWPKWVVLIAGIERRSITSLFALSTVTSHRMSGEIAYAVSATGSCSRTPLAIMAHAIRAILLASAIAATHDLADVVIESSGGCQSARAIRHAFRNC
jgi:hypothetical protein